MYAELVIPPGVYRNGTEYQVKARWDDGSLTRWYGEQLGPVGGWRKRSPNAVSGKARALLTWKTNAASPVRWIALGTETGLYVQGAGGTVTEISPTALVAGRADESVSIGFGVGDYGADAYGTPRKDVAATISDATVWDLDVFGQYLVACSPADGRLVEWQLNTGVIAAAITNAPTGCLGLVTTQDGFLMALGPGGLPRRAQWSDQGNDTTWTPSATNQAGSVDLVTQGVLRRGIRLGAAVLLFTDVDAHLGTYVGLPVVYAFQRLGTGCGLLGKGAVVGMGQQAVWWSKSGFWTYDGSLRLLECDVWEYLLHNVNPGQRSKISGLHNSRYGEAWWFYPSTHSTEVDSYVFWNYRQNHWGIGSLARLSAAQEGVFNYPLAVDASGYVYEHEVGNLYDGATPFAETGPIQLGAGDRVMRVNGVISDDTPVGEVTISFRTRAFPDGAQTTLGETTVTTAGFSELRFAAREAKMRITQAANDDWRFGSARLDVQSGGRR